MRSTIYSHDNEKGGNLPRTIGLSVSLAMAVGGILLNSEKKPTVRSSESPAQSQNIFEITKDIAEGKPLNILYGGTALIKLSNGSYVKIANPILTANDTVVERARDAVAKNQAVTAYTTTNSHSSNNVVSVTYTKGGENLSHLQAVSATSPLAVAVPSQASHGAPESYYLVAPGQPHAGEHIAQGTLEHTIVEFVPSP